MSGASQPGGGRTYRSPLGPIVLTLVSALALFLLGDAVARGSWGLMLLYAPWVLLAVWIVYEISFVSAVRVDDEGATVRNMLRTTRFGWRRVRDVDLRWQLEFALDDGTRVSCFGGPGRSRPPRQTGRGEGEVKVPASLQALTEIRDRWEAAVDAAPGPAGEGADAPIRRGWDLPAVAALAIIAIWAIAAILIAYA
ncbi:PH domain-containing protein [Microbacterium resistens]|uniref:PH domain-containing protein n=1 Tax=Microbacterium resistens TaxID=156977 RepID=A0ABY3RSE5_9MICO|nr:PH domain-containing protein [Microbacterium resistens]UGS26894.1 PH domain-containing protein [Microbacterium resistens]